MTSREREEAEPKVEADAIAGRVFWGTGAVTVVAVGVAILVAGTLLHVWTRAGVSSAAAPPPVAPAASAEIGIVEQTPILESRRGLDDRARQRKSLAYYGWVDAEHRVARIPIERAMDLVGDPSFMGRAFAADGGT